MSDTPGAGGGNLRPPRAVLFGRDLDALRVREALGRGRFVTLVGAGGSGKTSLAGTVGPAAASTLEATGWWVDLQPVRDDDQVAATVADVIGIGVAGGGDAAAIELARSIGERCLLLVMDNCEQVVDGVAALLDVVLDRCGEVRVLATSREAIGVPGEQVVPVEPLAVPAADAAAEAPAVMDEHAATALFLERAGLRAAELTEEERAAAVRVCSRLDGMPLAIELAAARSPVLTPTQLDAALDDRFRLLSTTRDRTAADRQRTLEASIRWSYDLIGTEDQQLLRRLSVFPARFDLHVAAAVGAGGDVIAAADRLQSLADRSLIVVAGRPSERRYRMQESVREFARARLEEHGESDDAQEAHLRATRDRLRRLGADEAHEDLLLRVESWIADELDDVRQATDWAQATGRPELLVDLWWPVHLWLGMHYRPREAYEAAVLATEAQLDDVRLARALTMRALGPAPASIAGEAESARRALALLWPDEAMEPGRPLTAFCALLWETSAWSLTRLGVERGRRHIGDAAERLVDLARANRDGWGGVPFLAAATAASRALNFAGRLGEAYEVSVAGAAEAERLGAPHLAAVLHSRAAGDGGAAGLPAGVVARHHAEAMAAAPDGGTTRAFLAAVSGWLVALVTGDVDGHRRRLEAHHDQAGAPGTTTASMMTAAMSSLHVTLGRPDEAIAACRDALAHVGDQPRDAGAIMLRSSLAQGLLAVGDLSEARDLVARIHEVDTDGMSLVLVQHTAMVAAAVDLRAELPDAALQRLTAVVAQSIEHGFICYFAGLAAHAAAALAALGRHHDAGLTLGIMTGDLEGRGAQLWPDWQVLADEAEAAGREALGDDGFEEAVHAGDGQTWQDWAAWLARGRTGRETERPPHGWPALTPTEVDVAEHAADGLSTAEIAEVMFVSPNTIKTHLKHIYRKLDVSSRVELAGVVDEHDGGG